MAALRDAITDVPGIRVGHWTYRRGATGCTAVLCTAGAVGGVDVRGAAPGTRETDLLRPGNLVDRVHGVVLSGGSAFGLAAADGVMRYLAERGHGLAFGGNVIPIVPAAILFDLGIGTKRAPDAEAGHRAARRATRGRVEEGSVGAGTGATVAKLAGGDRALKGGLGTASERLDVASSSGPSPPSTPSARSATRAPARRSPRRAPTTRAASSTSTPTSAPAAPGPNSTATRTARTTRPARTRQRTRRSPSSRRTRS